MVTRISILLVCTHLSFSEVLDPKLLTRLPPHPPPPDAQNRLLLDLHNILTVAHEDDLAPHKTSPPPDPPVQATILINLEKGPLLNRTKRIPHNDPYYTENSIDDSRPIYVTDNGDDVDKLPSTGPWTAWSGSSECSRTCGGGVAYNARQCSDPDSTVCSGPDTRYYSCNTHACGDRNLDFRAEQCSAYNNQPFEGRFYTWLPYTRAPNKCELNCMPQGERFYYRHKRKVIDGTNCGHDHVCVNGVCLPVGCDGVLGSRKRQDKCRVCGGDGSSCNTVQGVFDSDDLQVGYNDVLLIPGGATNILVKETDATNNYLAIRNTTGHYYLNGNWRIDFPREILVAGTTFHYERKPHTFLAPETIRALGPITEAIYIVILYQERNPGITFEYSVPRGVVTETPEGTEYAWIYDDWGECTRECGGGTQLRNVNCARRSISTSNWDYVEPHLCDAGVKPETFRYCNYEIACPVRWHVSTWDDCTAPCGSNETGTQYRNVFCEQEIQGVSALVENDQCVAAHGPAPEKLRNCTSSNTDECTYWFVGAWKGCDKLCGDGYNTRVVRCVSKDDMGRIVIHGDEKCPGGKPQEYESCFTKPCEGVDWIAEGKWGECQVPSTPTCNSPESAAKGTQSRQVYCSDAKGKVYDEKHCHSYRKPGATQACELDFNPAEDPSCKYTWYATQWSDCEFQSCSDLNRGKKSRRVVCGTVLGEDGSMKVVDEGKCNDTKKYHDEEDCAVGDEVVEKNCGDEEARRKGRWFAGPWGECSKEKGGTCRRTRAVLCMIGNRSTTDVKICGEDDLVFTSEDCDCDAVVEISTEDDEDSVTEDPFTEDDTSTGTEEPCEPLTDEDYEYFDYLEFIEQELEDEMRTEPMVTGRSTRSVFSTTEMSASTDDTTEDGVTMDTMMTEDSSVTMETGSGDGVTEAMELPVSGATEGAEADIGDGVTSATEEGVTGGSTVSGVTEPSTGTGGTTIPGVTASTGASDGTTTQAAADTTTEVPMTTTTESVTTTTEPSTTTTEPTTTTEQPTTTTMAPTTTEPVTTTTMGTTTMGAETTTMGVTTTTSGASDGTTMSMGVSSTTGTTGETTLGTPSADLTTLTPDVSPCTGDYCLGEAAGEGASQDDTYDLGMDGPPAKMVGTTDASVLETGGTGATDSDSMMPEDDESGVTEIEYMTDYATELGFTTGLPPVTLPKCKPKKRKAKAPSNCHKTVFGCCPGNETKATGPFHQGCNISKTCAETEFGCCDDGVTPALNKWKKNCKVDCKNTLFGCCPDGKGVAMGNNGEGCVKDCNETEYGCCLDGKTAKKGPKGRNCPKIPCAEAIYGCCPDDKTAALGPNYKDCKEINLENCKVNFFGCCIDGTTSALGFNEEGCPDTPPCARSEHGCCPDEVTFAHGPNNEGCCAASRWGCCPDNINEALGPDFKGCACTSSPYGCCPDNVTPARGPNQDCGCKFTEHGCCPDGVTQATGASFEGCGCSTYQYGCCPDGVTVAKGPSKQGCGCAYSEHGCCPDNRTPKNSSSEPCGCESSLFGCCPDGSTLAQGNDFEGCEDVPIKPGDVCGLDKERGSCRNFTVRWFFDMEYGGCSRFWWGGCEGNLNKFATQDACRSVCVEPEGRDACYLPRVSGPCEGYYPSWYYDPVRESCEQFVYSGCLGNNNRFSNKQECEHNCLLPERVDDCDQPKTEGPCRGNYSRWYYDKSSEKCEVFTYGGCKGNSNNFLTERECHQRCGKDVRMRDVCFQSRSEGGCGEKLPRWYYDGGELRCVPFYYSGCQGNSNRFGTLDECEKTCPAALLSETQGCADPVAVGGCSSHTERFYFDRYDNKCKAFTYSGCGGNTNNFMSIDDCRTKCETSVAPRPVHSSVDQQFSQAQCFAPPPDDPTSCSDPSHPATIRWYYDNHDGVCYQFRYYCSDSSLNNFETRQDCEGKCGDSQDLCNLPVVQGPCSGQFLQFYYDKNTDSCVAFDYSGCSGNGNRFDTVGQCEQRCKKTGGDDVLHGGVIGGAVEEDDDERRRYDEEIERRRVDEERRRIEDERRRADEERRRYDEEIARRAQEEDMRRPMSQDDICLLAVDQGPCRAAVSSFYFDAGVGKCTEFLYGGCGGNANRFESEEMCERQCGEFRGVDVCSQTVDPGPCSSDGQKSQKWWFNSNEQACSLFVYSGCGGNGNRFSSRDECESICHSRSEIINRNDTITGAAICRLPPETGPCLEPFKRYYYSNDEKTCVPFVFGGCAGNLNRFKSFDTCINFCEKALGYTYRERDSDSSHSVSQGVRSGDNGGGGIRGEAGVVVEPTPADGARNNYNYYADDNSSHLDPYNAPCDCSYLKCPYGLAPQNSTSYSCTCACNDPCSNYQCPDASYRCSVDIQQSRYVPVCRSVRKPGSCPNFHHTRHHHQSERICEQECTSDADCSGQLKCCVQACGSSCVVPVGSQDGSAGFNEVIIEAQTRNLNVSEGEYAELECVARGNPRPDVMWVKVDSNEKITGDSGRFRIKEQSQQSSIRSTLQIIAPSRQDEGTYQCVASTTNSPPSSDQIELSVFEPSSTSAPSVLEDPTLPTTQLVSLGQTANLRCFALGWPRPSVTWWRGERMLPLSSERYEQKRDHSLAVRLVSLRDLGVYTCQAYNGLGRAASWSVSLLAIGPVQVNDVDDREFLVYVIDTGRSNYTRVVQPAVIATTTTSTTTVKSVVRPSPSEEDYLRPGPDTHYLVPVRAAINLTRTQYSTGSDIRIPCVVEGYPTPQVSWYHDDAPIDPSSRRVRYEPPELVISEAMTSDAGNYRCEATNEYAQSTSSVSIQVDGVQLHPNCTDNSFFANCKLIVKANYCTNKYYARFCCKSCTLAGQLPTYGPHLNEAGQAYFRNRGAAASSSLQQNNRRGLSDSSNHHNELFN